MANYNINPAAVQGIEAELAGVATRLDNSLQTLQQSVQRFIVANDGQAPAAYTNAQMLWEQGQREMHAALVNGRRALQEITTGYVAADRRGAAVFGG